MCESDVCSLLLFAFYTILVSCLSICFWFSLFRLLHLLWLLGSRIRWWQGCWCRCWQLVHFGNSLKEAVHALDVRELWVLHVTEVHSLDRCIAKANWTLVFWHQSGGSTAAWATACVVWVGACDHLVLQLVRCKLLSINMLHSSEWWRTTVLLIMQLADRAVEEKVGIEQRGLPLSERLTLLREVAEERVA